ncbi:MAG: hypothetical protein R3D43_04940 [Tepidamorphaceae bacterium]
MSAGVAVKGSQDYDSGDKIGEVTQVEASIGGVVYSIPGRLVWTHKLGVAFGERESPDLRWVCWPWSTPISGNQLAARLSAQREAASASA